MALEKKPSQCDRVKRYVREHGSINFMLAIQELCITQIAARITELERAGEMIFKHEQRMGVTVDGKKYKYTEYILEVDNG